MINTKTPHRERHPILNTRSIVRLVVSVGIFIIILYNVNLTEIADRLRGLDSRFFTMALLVLSTQYFLSAFKWKIILKAENIRVPLVSLLNRYLIGNFISLFLPSTFGGDIYRVAALRRFNTDIYQNTSSVLFDRITGLFALTSLAIVAHTITFGSMINYFLIGGYVALLAGFLIFASDQFSNSRLFIGSKYLNPVIRIAESFNRYRHNASIMANTILFSFLFHNNVVIISKLYCLSLNIQMPLAYLYVVIPIVYITEAIPITINGLGLREGSFILLFQHLGYTANDAMALALLLITVRYSISLVLGGGLASLYLLSANKHQHT